MVGPTGLQLQIAIVKKSLQFTFMVAEVLPFISSHDPYLGNSDRAVDHLVIGQRAVRLRHVSCQCHARA